MANKRIDELTSAVPGNVDVVPTSYATTGPAYKSTVASVVAAGLNQPNSATAGAGANITIKAADGVTSGAGGSIVITPGLQAATGGDGNVKIRGGVINIRNETRPAESVNITVASIVSGGVTDVNISGSGTSIYSFSIAANTVQTNNMFYIQNAPYPSLSTGGLRLGSSPILFASGGTNGANDSVGLIFGSIGTIRVADASGVAIGSGGGSFAYTHSNIDLTGITNAAAFTGSGYQRITGGTVLNGILPPSGGAHISGRMIKIVNTTGSAITVNDDSASCTVVGNRLKTPSGSSINFGANHMLQCIYDTVDSRWRVWMTS